MSTKSGVPGIPLNALDAIKDENTRIVLQSIVDGWHVRNGSTGTGDNRFITASELKSFDSDVRTVINQVANTISTAPVTLSPGDINTIINDLQGSIINSPLWQELGERVDLIDLPNGLIDQLDEDRAALAKEIADRVAAVEKEIADRIQALKDQADVFNKKIQDEADARAKAILAEAEARGTAITTESTLRQTGDDQLAGLVTLLTAKVDNNNTVTLAAIQDEATARATADAAEATQRNTLAVQMRGNYTGTDLNNVTSGLLYSERQARVTADTANVSAINALSANLTNSVNSLTAQISAEQSARIAADAAEANERQSIRAQLVGGYTGNDLAQLTTGLLYQERVARVTQTSALAQQISLLTADVGGGFDPLVTWYFDGSTDGWANASYSAGWITVSSTTERAMPTGGVNGAKYSSVKMRIRRASGSSWTGLMYYTSNGSTYTAYAANPNISVGQDAVVEWEMANVSNWTSGTITYLKFDLGSTFDIDWIAVGRNGPAASTASIAEESLARSTADSVEASKRESLSIKLVGTADPTNATIANITTGLLADERNLRAAADGTEIVKRETLSIKILGAPDPNSVSSLATLSAGLLFDEKQARITANQAVVTQINSLTAEYQTNKASVDSKITALTNSDVSQINTLNALSTRMGNAEAAITSETNARASADSSMLTQLNAAITRIGAVETGLTNESNSRANSDNAITTNVNTQFATVNGNISQLQTTTTTLSNNVSSLTSQVSTLQSTVNGQAASIQAEQTARVNADNTINAKYSIKVDVNGYVSGFGLMATANNSTPTSEFIVRADKFAIGNPSNPQASTEVIPFIVKTTSETKPNGTVIPPGVYMTTAMVKELYGTYIEAGYLRTGYIYVGTNGLMFMDSSTNKEIKSTAIGHATDVSTGPLRDAVNHMNPLMCLFGASNNVAVPLDRRVRLGNVNFLVSVTGVVDSWLSLWVRVNRGFGYEAWVHLAGTSDSQDNYGAAALTALTTINITQGCTVQFGISSYDQYGWIYNSDKSAIQNYNVSIFALNF